MSSIYVYMPHSPGIVKKYQDTLGAFLVKGNTAQSDRFYFGVAKDGEWYFRDTKPNSSLPTSKFTIDTEEKAQERARSLMKSLNKISTEQTKERLAFFPHHSKLEEVIYTAQGEWQCVFQPLLKPTKEGKLAEVENTFVEIIVGKRGEISGIKCKWLPLERKNNVKRFGIFVESPNIQEESNHFYIYWKGEKSKVHVSYKFIFQQELNLIAPFYDISGNNLSGLFPACEVSLLA